MKKLLYLSLATFSLVFTSCSINKSSVNSGYLKSDKLLANQQLTTQPSNHEKMTPINIPVSMDMAKANSYNVQGNTVKFQNQGLKGHIKLIGSTNIVTKASKSLAAVTNLPRAIASAGQIMKMPTHLSSTKNRQLDNTVSLILWIALLVLSVVFFFLINVFGELTFLGVLFNVLAILALVGFLIFFILWITQIYKRKHHIN